MLFQPNVAVGLLIPLMHSYRKLFPVQILINESEKNHRLPKYRYDSSKLLHDNTPATL